MGFELVSSAFRFEDSESELPVDILLSWFSVILIVG